MSRVYSPLKFLGFTDRLDALRRREVAAPVHVRIKPINRCNHNCWYCAYRADSLQLGSGMDVNDRIPGPKMFEIADDLIAMGVKAVTFSGGGEPLLYKPLPEVIERLAAGGVRIGLLTNGSNLQGRMAEAVGRHATWVRVSVDAWDDASYAASRAVRSGEFTRLLDNLRAFTAAWPGCALGVSLIVSRENAAHIAETCALFKSVGARHVKLSAAVVANDATESNAYHAVVVDLVAAQIEQAERLNDEHFHIVNHYHELGELFERTYKTCPYLMFLTVIGADMTVYTCQDKAYTDIGALGSIAGRSFRAFWFSPENQHRLFSFDPSRNCRHHCVSHAKNLAVLDHLALDPDHSVFV